MEPDERGTDVPEPPAIVLTQREDGSWEMNANVPDAAACWVICEIAAGLRRKIS